MGSCKDLESQDNTQRSEGLSGRQGRRPWALGLSVSAACSGLGRKQFRRALSMLCTYTQLYFLWDGNIARCRGHSLEGSVCPRLHIYHGPLCRRQFMRYWVGLTESIKSKTYYRRKVICWRITNLELCLTDVDLLNILNISILCKLIVPCTVNA